MTALVSAAAVVLTPHPLNRFSQLSAHHSFEARYDPNKPVRLQGLVARVDWTNPHTWIYLDVMDRKGKVVRWAIEAESPSMLVKQGFTKETLPPGTPIVVEGLAAKTNERIAVARTITPNGKRATEPR